MATATNDLTTAAYPGNFNLEKSGDETIQSRARYIDATVVNLAAGSYKAFFVPSGATIIGGWTVVKVDGGETATLAVGNATTADTYRAAAISGADGTVVAFTNTPNTFTADNEIQFTIADADFAGAFWIVVEYLPSDKKKA